MRHLTHGREQYDAAASTPCKANAWKPSWSSGWRIRPAKTAASPLGEHAGSAGRAGRSAPERRDTRNEVLAVQADRHPQLQLAAPGHA